MILFFGVLYHLRYPLLGIDRIRSVSCGDVFIETYVIDNCFITRFPWNFLNWFRVSVLIARLTKRTPMWRQYKEFELNPKDQSNWFGPNLTAVIESFQSADFDCEHLHSFRDRATCRARVNDTPPARLLVYCSEAFRFNRDIVGVSSTFPEASGA